MSNHLNKDWLYQKYVIEGLSTYDIGKIVQRDPKRVYEKLKDFGIKTRPRGENLKGDDNYMKTAEENPFKGKTHSKKTRKILSDKAKGPKPHLQGANNGMFGRTGKSNPNYKDGSSPERQRLYASSKWKQLIKHVYKRDDYKCQRCGSPHHSNNKLHAHHLTPWADSIELRFDPSNLITLCNSCHAWVHSNKNTNNEFLRLK